MSAHAEPLDRQSAVTRSSALGRADTARWMTLGVAAVLSAIAFGAGGGLQLGSETTVAIGLTLGGSVLVVGALAVETRAPLYGAGAIGMIFALALYTAASVIWSVAPDASFVEAGRTLSYAFTFLAGVALVRLAPARLSSLLVGVLLASLVVSGYALATKVLPDLLNPGETYARLRDPFGYWNGVGLTAALGIPGCLWLGSRRSGHAAVGALAYPAVMLLLVTIMLAYSRGALLALAIGLVFWFATVPLRLRGLAVLGLGLVGAVPIVLWTFHQDALSADNVALAARTHSGHLLGLMIVGLAVIVTVAGLWVRFAAAARPPSDRLRRRAAVAVLVVLALVPVAFAGRLAASSRGLDGSVSHAWRSLTDPSATTPPNDPSRLTAVGSVRARYWNDALKVAKAHPLVGVGAGGYATARLQVRTDTLGVQNAHGYVVQTLADLGILGMAISLLLCAAWVLAAIRTVGGARTAGAARGAGGAGGAGVAGAAGGRGFGRGRRGRALGGGRLARGQRGTGTVGAGVALSEAETGERIGLLTLITVVVVFAVHSSIDITWFVPGDAVIGLLCAGWVAGRGPFRSSLVDPRGAVGRSAITRPSRALAAGAVVVLGLAVAWSQWQPLRSQEAQASALSALAQGNQAAARSRIQTAISRDPLSVDALFDLSTIETAAGDPAGARAALVRAVRLVPSNPRAWEQLATFDLSLGNRTAALQDLGPALYLDPESYAGISQYLDTFRALGTPTPTPSPAVPGAGAAVTSGATPAAAGSTSGATPGPGAAGSTSVTTPRPGATPGETPALGTPGTP
ncbi:MAG: hypothetical protein QOH12_1538 [Solirubrobacteraceae bacterium]|nr:hypothetical protein [Solirubrobacteraceae bacterium]